MKLSEELLWRGFKAETTIKDDKNLDERKRKFYLGADPSADSLTIGNLAALMMARCFVRHGYEPFLLVGGATGQIGDPKETGERELKSLKEVEHNKKAIGAQMRRILAADNFKMVDNYDWFKNIGYLSFLREVGKAFSMTQLLDRQFVQARIGKGGSGISYAEFSYTLIQGYDFLHLYREYGVDLQLCGADQFGNCTSGIHLIKRIAGGEADAWSTPLVIDPVSGRKFGKSEGNAIWLDSQKTSVFDFYQFWLGQPDAAVERLLKIYTDYTREEVDKTLEKHLEAPEERLAQKMLALGATTVVHGQRWAELAEEVSVSLFDKNVNYSEVIKKIIEVEKGEKGEKQVRFLPKARKGEKLRDILVRTELAESKNEARRMIAAGAVTVNGKKVEDMDEVIVEKVIVKRGKNKFAVVE